MIYSLYGQPNSGKTTLANLISAKLKIPVVNSLDEEDFNKAFGYDSEDKRKEKIRNANVVASYLHSLSEKSVVMSFVNPYEDLRKELRAMNDGKVIEIFLYSSRTEKKEFHVEQFREGSPEFRFETDKSAIATWDTLCNAVFNDRNNFTPYNTEWFTWREESLNQSG